MRQIKVRLPQSLSLRLLSLASARVFTRECSSQLEPANVVVGLLAHAQETFGETVWICVWPNAIELLIVFNGQIILYPKRLVVRAF